MRSLYLLPGLLLLSASGAFAQEHSISNRQEQRSDMETEASFIRQWQTGRPDIRIVPRSQFVSLTADAQQLYLALPDCMILVGETVTAHDIELFELQ
jgi:hypothetical protein